MRLVGSSEKADSHSNALEIEFAAQNQSAKAAGGAQAILRCPLLDYKGERCDQELSLERDGGIDLRLHFLHRGTISEQEEVQLAGKGEFLLKPAIAAPEEKPTFNPAAQVTKGHDKVNMQSQQTEKAKDTPEKVPSSTSAKTPGKLSTPADTLQKLTGNESKDDEVEVAPNGTIKNSGENRPETPQNLQELKPEPAKKAPKRGTKKSDEEALEAPQNSEELKSKLPTKTVPKTASKKRKQGDIEQNNERKTRSQRKKQKLPTKKELKTTGSKG